MNALIEALKAKEQDFEFYPTTNEIIEALCLDFSSYAAAWHRRRGSGEGCRILDIGAGTGKVLSALEKTAASSYSGTDLFAFEKSSILCAQLPEDVLILGTDFHEQTLVGRKMDVIFCNPPYKEFEQWASRIIREACASVVYLVIPRRWAGSEEIAASLKAREVRASTIGVFDFEDSEDRRARAKVDLLRIDYKVVQQDKGFDAFFENEFADFCDKFKEDVQWTPKPDQGEKAVVKGADFVQRLVEAYNAELESTYKNYKDLANVSTPVLHEFGIVPLEVKKKLTEKVKLLKETYWRTLFKNLAQVTDRLTTRSREKVLARLHRHGQVDFTHGNIKAILGWLLRNANTYIDGQLISVFEGMVESCNVKRYASNQRVWANDVWRYRRTEDVDAPSHFKLEYRVVMSGTGGLNGPQHTWPGLNERAANDICDLLTVAKNLGFMGDTNPTCLMHAGRREWKSGKPVTFAASFGGRTETLLEVKAFLNGNLHIRMHQEFAMALNVEYGRLKGWLKSGEEAEKELGEKGAGFKFGTNRTFVPDNALLLLSNESN